MLQDWTTDRPLNRSGVFDYESNTNKANPDWLLGFFLLFIVWLLLTIGGWKKLTDYLGI